MVIAFVTLTIAAGDSAVCALSLTGLIESWAKILGIFAAGLWTYLIFIRQRQRYPRASISQSVLYQRLPIDKTLVIVSVNLGNIGATLIEVDYVEVIVGRLSPLKKSLVSAVVKNHDPLDSAAEREFRWFRVAHRRTGFKTGHLEIEPGESEQINFDFVIGGNLEQLKVEVHVENVFKRNTLRDWLRAKLGQLPIVSIRSANRCIGWGCVSYYRISPQRDVLTKAALPSSPEADNERERQEHRAALASR